MPGFSNERQQPSRSDVPASLARPTLPTVTSDRETYLYTYPDPLVLLPGYKWILYTVGPNHRELSEDERIARKLPVAMRTREGTHDLVVYRHLLQGGRKKRSTRVATKKRNGVSRRTRRRV